MFEHSLDFTDYLQAFTSDTRVTVWHIAILFAVLYLSEEKKNEISISRRRIMKLAHINSIATYHKYLKELQEFGYIEYKPTYHPGLGSTIILKIS